MADELARAVTTAAAQEIDGTKGPESAYRQAQAAVAAALRVLDNAGYIPHDAMDIPTLEELAARVEGLDQ